MLTSQHQHSYHHQQQQRQQEEEEEAGGAGERAGLLGGDRSSSSGGGAAAVSVFVPPAGFSGGRASGIEVKGGDGGGFGSSSDGDGSSLHGALGREGEGGGAAGKRGGVGGRLRRCGAFCLELVNPPLLASMLALVVGLSPPLRDSLYGDEAPLQLVRVGFFSCG